MARFALWTLLSLSLTLITSTGSWAQDPEKAAPKTTVDFFAGGMWMDGKYVTTQANVNRTNSKGKGMKGDFIGFFGVADSMKTTFVDNKYLTGHFSDTLFSGTKGRTTLQAGVGAAREINYSSRTNQAGPVATLSLAGKIPLNVATRLDLGTVGVIGGPNTRYVGVAIDASTNIKGSITPFYQARVGQNLNVEAAGAVVDLEAIKRLDGKVPVAVTVYHLNDNVKSGGVPNNSGAWIVNASYHFGHVAR